MDVKTNWEPWVTKRSSPKGMKADWEEGVRQANCSRVVRLSLESLEWRTKRRMKVPYLNPSVSAVGP